MPLIIGIVVILIVLAIIGLIGNWLEKKAEEENERKFRNRVLFVTIVIAALYFGPDRLFILTKLFASGLLLALAIVGIIVFIFFPPAGAVLEIIVMLIAVLTGH